jgi:hypothetical protein
MILLDDEYVRINEADAMAGDVIVYSTNGDPEHSGIVVSRNAKGTWILSKWGPYHEVIHLVTDCPYDATEIVFYRIVT